MSLWQALFAIAVVFAQAMVAVIPFIEKDSFGDDPLVMEFANVFASHRPMATFLFGTFAGLGVLATVLIKPRRTRQAYRESLIDGMFEQILDNDKTRARITIFCDVRWPHRLWKKIKDFYYLKWTEGQSFKQAWGYVRHAGYIKIKYRWGTEHRNSKTYFCVNSQTADLCQGVAGQVRQREEAITVSLPRIDEIDHTKATEDDPSIADYMNRGHISDINVLRSLNKPSPFIYGALVSTNGGRRKYVLVVDSWAAVTPFVLRVKTTVLPAYIKQLSAALDSRS